MPFLDDSHRTISPFINLILPFTNANVSNRSFVRVHFLRSWKVPYFSTVRQITPRPQAWRSQCERMPIDDDAHVSKILVFSKLAIANGLFSGANANANFKKC